MAAGLVSWLLHIWWIMKQSKSTVWPGYHSQMPAFAFSDLLLPAVTYFFQLCLQPHMFHILCHGGWEDESVNEDLSSNP